MSQPSPSSQAAHERRMPKEEHREVFVSHDKVSQWLIFVVLPLCRHCYEWTEYKCSHGVMFSSSDRAFQFWWQWKYSHLPSKWLKLPQNRLMSMKPKQLWEFLKQRASWSFPSSSSLPKMGWTEIWLSLRKQMTGPKKRLPHFAIHGKTCAPFLYVGFRRKVPAVFHVEAEYLFTPYLCGYLYDWLAG